MSEKEFNVTLSDRQGLVIEKWCFGVIPHPGPQTDKEIDHLIDKFNHYWTDQEIEMVAGWESFEKEIMRSIRSHLNL